MGKRTASLRDKMDITPKGCYTNLSPNSCATSNKTEMVDFTFLQVRSMTDISAVSIQVETILMSGLNEIYNLVSLKSLTSILWTPSIRVAWTQTKGEKKSDFLVLKMTSSCSTKQSTRKSILRNTT